jgi:hypothetical protein
VKFGEILRPYSQAQLRFLQRQRYEPQLDASCDDSVSAKAEHVPEKTGE